MKQNRFRVIIGISAAAIIACGTSAYLSFKSPEAVLSRELKRYRESVWVGNPRPDFVTHLSAESIPILLKWLQVTNHDPNLGERLYYVLWKGANRFGIDDRLGMRSTIQEYPPELAVVGFGFLGSKAAPALPQLAILARSDLASNQGSEVYAALTAIGEPSLQVAAEFCGDSSPVIRRRGAFLIRRLVKLRERSIALLLPLLDDPHPGVRFETHAALAQFPGSDLESVLIGRLRSLGESADPNVAYALHTGSTNALIHLVDLVIASTNLETRIPLLAALVKRDQGWDHETLSDIMRFIAERDPSNDALYLIRSNIVHTGVPNVIKSYQRLNPDLLNNGQLMELQE